MGLFSDHARQLKFVLLADSSRLDRDLKKAETRLQRFGKNTGTLGAGLKGGGGGLGSTAALLKGGGIALGAGLAANQVVKLADAASDLNEQITKSQAVFGQSSAAIGKWSTTTAESLGISRTAALEASGTFGNLFNTVGIDGAKAGDMSETLVKLGADLASFNNADPSETLAAIRSGLIGEAEPLRRFGVLLSETRVQQRAMADTGKKSASALTAQEKALARYEIILNDTKKAQGDFARTSGGLANQQRILQAKLADTRAELGTRLLPVMIRTTEAANKLLSAFDGNKLSTNDLFSAKVRKDLLSPFGPEKLAEIFAKLVPVFNAQVKAFSESIQPIELKIKPATDSGPIPFGQPGFKTVKPQAVPRPGATVTQKNNWFDTKIGRELDRVQDIPGLQGQIKRLQGIKGEIQAKLATTKDPTRRATLGDEIVGIDRQIKGLNDDIAAGLKSKADGLKTARAKMAQGFKDQASDIKNAVLDAFDTKTTKIDNARALSDAKEELRIALQEGGAKGIQAAKRHVQDANLAIGRQRIEDTPFSVRKGPPGPVNSLRVGSMVFNITTSNPKAAAKEVVRLLNKNATAGSQSRGTVPGHAGHRGR